VRRKYESRAFPSIGLCVHPAKASITATIAPVLAALPILDSLYRLPSIRSAASLQHNLTDASSIDAACFPRMASPGA
jgi:hypothetical protein